MPGMAACLFSLCWIVFRTVSTADGETVWSHTSLPLVPVAFELATLSFCCSYFSFLTNPGQFLEIFALQLHRYFSEIPRVFITTLENRRFNKWFCRTLCYLASPRALCYLSIQNTLITLVLIFIEVNTAYFFSSWKHICAVTCAGVRELYKRATYIYKLIFPSGM